MMRRTIVWAAVLGVAALSGQLLRPVAAADAPKTAAKTADSGKADAKKPTADETKWRALFDGKTLKDWKTPSFGEEGKVSVKDGTIVIGAGALMTGVAYTGPLPKMDYELTLEGMRIAGDDFFCTTTFPVGDSFV
jgi:hypothetical protein